MRIKKGLYIIAAVTVFGVLSGCTKDYGRNDIGDYVKERCGIRSFKVSKEPAEVTSDEDTYTDYLWTVTEKDGTEFHVLDDYHWGMEALVNSLRTDYFSVHLVRDFSLLPHSALTLVSETEEGLCYATLNCRQR